MLLQDIVYVYPTYTEHQKKLITSSERHSLKSDASKCSSNHIWTQISYNCPCQKKKVSSSHKGDKCEENARGQFKKITKIVRLSGWKFAANESRYGSYITRHWNWMNSLNRLPPSSSLGEQFLWFSKNDLLRFHHIFLHFDTSKPLFCRCSY